MSNSVSCMLLVTWNKLHLFKLLLLLLYYYYSLYYCNSALVETNVNWLFYRQYINETYIYTYIHTLYILISSTFFSVRLHQVLYLPIKIRVGVPISLVMKISLVREVGKFVQFWRHICFHIWLHRVLPFHYSEQVPPLSRLMHGLYIT